MRLIVGISGATGPIYGIRLLEVLKGKGIETHLILSSIAKEIIIPCSIKTLSGIAHSYNENLMIRQRT